MLRAVHRGIGVTDQIQRRRRAATRGRDANAGAEKDWLLADSDRPGERGEQAARKGGRFSGAPEAAAGDDELIAAEACEEVAVANRATEPVADRGEDVVTDRVPEAVVQEREVLDVEQQHRDGPPGTAVSEQLLGVRHQRRPLWQARRRIEISYVRHQRSAF